MKFINRQKEIKFLKDHFASEPNSLLFLYGPKSSGKTTLIEKVINQLDLKKYSINYMNLRRVLIYNFKSFLDIFFQKDLKGKVIDLIDGITINTGFFGVKMEEEGLLKKNAFKVMEKKLISAKSRGKQPILIIDEIQLLKNIAINGERYLIDELFNLFVGLSKELHTTHIILATSDSYYIEEIYNNAKLMETTNLYFVDHFDKNTITHWLKPEKFKDKEIENIWYYLGGSPWKIQELIMKKNNGESVDSICKSFVDDHYGKLSYYRSNITDKAIRGEFDRINKIIVEQGSYIRNDSENADIINPLIKEMVSHDFWFYKVDEQKITANSQSLLRAFERMTL